MTAYKKIYILSVFLLPAFLVSCLTSPPKKKEEPPPVKKVAGKQMHGPMVILDKQAKTSVKIQKTHSEFLPTGQLKATVLLKNTSEKPYKFSYKFIWLDNQSRTLELPSNTWKEKVIMSGDMTELSAIAPKPECRGFRLKVTTLE